MRKYETFFIVDPDLPDETVAVLDEKVNSIVSSNGGTVLSYVPWGKKKLAYTVKKRSRGLYILMEYASSPELVAELERNMRLDDRIIKFITVKLEDRFDPEKESLRKSSASASDEEEAADASADRAESGEEAENEEYEAEENNDEE